MFTGNLDNLAVEIFNNELIFFFDPILSSHPMVIELASSIKAKVNCNLFFAHIRTVSEVVSSMWTRSYSL
jgi:hypothetical protein